MLCGFALAPILLPWRDGGRSCGFSSTGRSLGLEMTVTRGLGVCHLREGNAGRGCVVVMTWCPDSWGFCEQDFGACTKTRFFLAAFLSLTATSLQGE